MKYSPRFAVGAALAIVFIASSLSTRAAGCGVPITAEEMMHGRIPTEDNLDCGDNNAGPRQQDNGEAERRAAERQRERLRQADREFRKLLRKQNEDRERLNRQMEKDIQRQKLRDEEAERERELQFREDQAAVAAGQERADRAFDEMNRKLAPTGPAQRSPVNRLPDKNPFAKASGPPPKPNPFAKTAPQHPPTAAPVSSPNPNPTPPQFNASQSSSCSDITGLPNGSPRVTNCNAGNTAFTQARTLSNQNPAAARDKYQEAADAYRRAGDIAMADAIIAQINAIIAANQTPPSEPPASPPTAQPQEAPPAAPSEKPCGPSLQQAAPYIAGAEQAIKMEPKSCAALAAAASNFRKAGMIFLNGVPTDTAREALANTCEYKKSQEMLARSTALDDQVDRMKQAHQCREQCRGDLADLDEMQKAADAMPPAARGGRSEAANKMDLMILMNRFDLASRGCRKAGGWKPTKKECLLIETRLMLGDDRLSPAEAHRRVVAAGCT